jgi:hypothetical protein
MASSSKIAILEWVNNAKTDVTKQKRVRETVRLAKLGLRANHYLAVKKAVKSRDVSLFP